MNWPREWLNLLRAGPVVLVSFMSDGRMIYSIPVSINVGNAPFDNLLASLAHGEWIQTGTHEFAHAAFAFNSTLHSRT